MGRVRPPAVAGMFYPAAGAKLRMEVRRHVRQAHGGVGPPKAVIAPHAGYACSGPVAGSAYAAVARGRGTVRRVVLIGPSHGVWFRGLAVTRCEAFHTPLGDVPLDTATLGRLELLSSVRLLEPAHAGEHALEVHLPFLQEVLGDFVLVPITVGDALPEDVAAVLEEVWGGPETLVVVSSDLSHYHDAATTRRLDDATACRIQRCEPVDGEQACGSVAINGLLIVAARRGLRVSTVDLRSSADTAGDRERAVGYGAFLFHEEEAA